MQTCKAELSDLKRIQDLSNELYEYEKNKGLLQNFDKNWTYSNTGESFFRSRIEADYGIALLVKNNSDKVIGYCLGIIQHLPSRNDSPICDLENIFVKETSRKSGAGLLLLQTFENLAKNRGAKTIRVRSGFGNDLANEFYEKNDFLQKEIIYEREIK
jgi:GNAT superfamily N-acetyltransferase